MDSKKDDKKGANPLYLRPYTAGGASSTPASYSVSSSGAASRSAASSFTPNPLGQPGLAQQARRYRPKVAGSSSPTHRPQKLEKKRERSSDDEEKKEDEGGATVGDALDVLERLEIRGSTETQGANPPLLSFAQRNRVRFNTAVNFNYNRASHEKKGQGQSKDLMDVSRVEDGKYRPITIPFVSEEAVREKEKKDEASSSLCHEEGEWLEDQLTLIQMPCILPEPVDCRDEAIASNSQAGINAIPDGKIGKMRVYKSGAVKMDIGGVEFEVLRGCDMKCHQEVCCVSVDQKVCMFMGPVPNKAVVVPALSSILKNVQQPNTAGGVAASIDAAPAAAVV